LRIFQLVRREAQIKDGSIDPVNPQRGKKRRRLLKSALHWFETIPELGQSPRGSLNRLRVEIQAHNSASW
jgi:hypothetical protein